MDVWIVGSGIVGQATGKGFLTKRHRVVFTDTNPDVLSNLQAEGLTAISPGTVVDHKFDIIFLCVQTPTMDGRFDPRALLQATQEVGDYLRSAEGDPVVVVRSTVLPGTTRHILQPSLERSSQKRVGEGFTLASYPAFIRRVRALKDFLHPRSIILGPFDPWAATVLREIHQGFRCPIIFTTPEAAEAAKYVSNIFNAMKISYFRSMRRTLRKAGLSDIEVQHAFECVVHMAQAAWDPFYGTHRLGPFGGPCLPKDLRSFLTWAQQDLGEDLPMLSAVLRVNERGAGEVER